MPSEHIEPTRRRPPLSSLLGPREVLWPDSQRGPWLVSADFGRIGDRMEVVGLNVRSLGAPDLEKRFALARRPRGLELPALLTVQVWRSLPVGRLTAQLRAAWLAALDESGLLERNPAAAERWTAQRRQGGVDLEQVAAVYLKALAEGRSPTEAVRVECGPMSKSAAAQRVSRACDAGFLVRTKKGRAAGPPGVTEEAPTDGAG